MTRRSRIASSVLAVALSTSAVVRAQNGNANSVPARVTNLEEPRQLYCFQQ